MSLDGYDRRFLKAELEKIVENIRDTNSNVEVIKEISKTNNKLDNLVEAFNRLASAIENSNDLKREDNKNKAIIIGGIKKSI